MYLDIKNNKGFTIIELVISIFILSVAVIGIYNSFTIITILTSDSVDNLTATYLAQEGMEIVRNIRDTNWLTMDACLAYEGNCPIEDFSWVDGLVPGTVTNSVSCISGCKADYTSTMMSPHVSGSYLYLNSNGFYSYDSGTKTKFERKIIITPVIDTDVEDQGLCFPYPDQIQCPYHIIKVTVQVSWDKKATVFNSSISADNCNVSGGSLNCIVIEETLYDWYNYVNQ